MSFRDISEQDSVFLSRVKEAADVCLTRSIPKYIGFIDERQAALASFQLDGMGFKNYCFRGGWDDAKRVFLCILPDYMSVEEQDEYPVFCCYFRFRDCDKLSHRDFLGSIMALGVKRDAVGDILVKDGEAVVFTTETVSQLILSEITNPSLLFRNLNFWRVQFLLYGLTVWWLLSQISAVKKPLYSSVRKMST